MDIGDIVELKSGSAPMTVTAVEGDEIECHWAEIGKLRHKRFPKAALKTSKPVPSLEELILESLRGPEQPE